MGLEAISYANIFTSSRLNSTSLYFQALHGQVDFNKTVL